MTGASLVPVMVTSICLVTMPPWPVVERNGEALDLGLTRREVFHRAVLDAVAPGDAAAGAGTGGVRRP